MNKEELQSLGKLNFFYAQFYQDFNFGWKFAWKFIVTKRWPFYNNSPISYFCSIWSFCGSNHDLFFLAPDLIFVSPDFIIVAPDLIFVANDLFLEHLIFFVAPDLICVAPDLIFVAIIEFH